MFRIFSVIVLGFPLLSAHAQENSPFSRYGLGDFSQGQHLVSRSLGGLTAAYADGTSNNNGQTINFENPAAYSNLFMVSYDIGLTYDSRSLRSKSPDGKFVSNNLTPSYFAVGMPLSKKRGIGFAFGLRPVSKIFYSVVDNSRALGDSISKVYQGNGGLNQVFVGFAKRWKGLSLGFNTGAYFGKKETATLVSFVNDTIAYRSSNSSTSTNFSSLYASGGMQYEFLLLTNKIPSINTIERYLVRLGVNGNLGNDLKATQDIERNTFYYNSVGSMTTVDSVYSQKNIKGIVHLPSSYAAGITLRKSVQGPRGLFDIWSIGAEYTSTKWSEYRFYNQPDKVTDNWMFKLGAQFSPDPSSGRSIWGAVNYRIGFFTGTDYVNADGNGLKVIGGSMGCGLPIRKWNNYSNQFAIVNTALQFGKRGSAANNITEGFFKLSVGLSLSDIWFIKRRYD